MRNAVLALAWLALGCTGRGSDRTEVKCFPGFTESCPCPDHQTGTRACREEGGFDLCVCPTETERSAESAPSVQQRQERVEELTGQVLLQEKIANESKSQEDRAEARERLKELRRELTRANMLRLSSPECIANPLDPSCALHQPPRRRVRE